MPDQAPVGVFDSGVGGLSVLREIRQLLPNESLLYVADSGHVPYGEKSAEFIRARSQHIAEFLLGQGAKALVLACNDRCLSALKHVRQGGRIAYPNGVEPLPQGPEGVEVIAYDGVPSQKTLERLNELIEAGPFHVEIGHVYAMEEAVRAQKEVLQHHLGKLTLRIH